MKLLNNDQIKQKIQRLAYQIAENNFDKSEIILCGINNNGYALAKLIEKSLKKIIEAKISLNRIKLKPANPGDHPIIIEKPIAENNGNSIIIVDDVANTGRTIFYAFQPLLLLKPSKVEVAVLMDRKHKLFPIHVDYVGMSLATTIHENIVVKLIDVDEFEVHLQ
jgi:pyrimidine operon attenuation protein/uracil phosphoribosyltransferase